jgi:HK97 family phage portal protein
MVAGMEPSTYRGKGQNRQDIDDPKFIASPSNVFDAYEWRFAGTVSLAIAGEQMGLILGSDAAGYPTTCEWVWPERFDVTDNGIGSKPSYRLDGAPIPEDRVWHRRNFAMPGRLRGVDPLSNSGLLEVAKAARDFGRNWFENGATPSWILQPTTDPGEDGVKALLARWQQATGRKRKPVVIPQSVKAQQISVNAEESQFLATINEAEASIAMALGIPVEWVGKAASGSSVTYANRDQRQQDLMVTTLNHYVTIWNRALSGALPPSDYVRLNTATVLRSDLLTRMGAYKLSAEIQQLTGSIIYTEEEMRDLEDRTPLPPREQVPTKTWQAVGLPALVDGQIITPDEAREELGRGPIPGGNVLRQPAAAQGAPNA